MTPILELATFRPGYRPVNWSLGEISMECLTQNKRAERPGIFPECWSDERISWQAEVDDVLSSRRDSLYFLRIEAVEMDLAAVPLNPPDVALVRRGHEAGDRVA